MGVYNVIKNKTKCPKCQSPVEWQSKRLEYDGFLLANVMQGIKLNERMDGEMHTFCDRCKLGFDVTIEKGEKKEIKSSGVIKIINNS